MEKEKETETANYDKKNEDDYNYKHYLCSLYYFSTRLEPNKLDELFEYFTNVLHNLIKNAREHKEDKLLHNYFLNNICNLISHTRSIEYGKGERDTSYMMLYCLYCCLPTICEKYFPFFINSGSWKDIKYLCDFVRRITVHRYDDTSDDYWGYLQHPMIKMCILYCLNSLDDSAVSVYEKQLILKWIPREKSAFDWVFQKTVVLWAEKHYPHILQTATKGGYNEESALRKCKMLFRQWKPVMTETNTNTNTPINTNTNIRSNRGNLEFPGIIKKAFDLLHYKKRMGFQNISADASVDAGAETGTIDQQKWQEKVKKVNREWLRICNSCGTLENFLPVLAIHYKIDDTNREPFYNAIAVALLMCEKSTIQKRIMLCNEKGGEPVWIILDSCADLFSMICLLDDSLPMNMYRPDLEPVLKLLEYAVVKPQSPIIRKTRIRLSIIGNAFERGDGCERAMDDGEKKSIFQFIYWWTGNRNGGLQVLPHETIRDKTYYICGNSIGCVDFFSHYCFDLSYHNLVLTMINNRQFSTPAFFI